MNDVELVLIKPNDKKNIYGTIPGEYTAIDPPYWLALMGGYLRDQGVRVALLDAEHANEDPAETARKVAALSPRLVGILSIGSNLTACTWKMHGSGVLAKAIKEEARDLPLFLWGQHVSALPERTLREEAVDFVVAGEGFDTVLELVKTLRVGKRDYDSIGGLWHKAPDGTIRGNNHIQYIQDLDALPVDGWELLADNHYRNHQQFAFEDLSKRDRYGCIATSLGCPYQCTYCAICRFSGEKNIRYKTPERAMEEVDYWVRKHNVYYLRVYDECFTFNRNHVERFCDLMIERGYHLSLWINARTDLVDEALLAKMYQAGVRWIGYGFESGSKRIRGKVRKDQYTLEQIKRCVKITHDAGISICSNFMFGLPDDDHETMQESLDLARELNCEHPNFYCTMPYPGSKLYADCVRDGVELPDSWLGYTQLGYECHPMATKYLTPAEVLAFRDYAFQAFYENNDAYFDNIRRKFGEEPVRLIKKMLDHKLRRRLLEETERTV